MQKQKHSYVLQTLLEGNPEQAHVSNNGKKDKD